MIRSFFDFLTHKRPDVIAALSMLPDQTYLPGGASHPDYSNPTKNVAISRFVLEEGDMSFPITHGNYKAPPTFPCPLVDLEALEECVSQEAPKLFLVPVRKYGSMMFRRNHDSSEFGSSDKVNARSSGLVTIHPLHLTQMKSPDFSAFLSRWKRKYLVLDSGFFSYADVDDDGEATSPEQTSMWLIGATVHIQRTFFACASKAEVEKACTMPDVHRRRLSIVCHDRTRVFDLEPNDDNEFFSWLFAFVHHITFANNHVRTEMRAFPSIDVQFQKYSDAVASSRPVEFEGPSNAQEGKPSSSSSSSSSAPREVNVLRGLGFSSKALDVADDSHHLALRHAGSPGPLVHLEKWNKYNSLLVGNEKVLFAGKVKRSVIPSGILGQMKMIGMTHSVCDLVLTSENRMLCTDVEGAEVIDECILVLNDQKYVTAHLVSWTQTLFSSPPFVIHA